MISVTYFYLLVRCINLNLDFRVDPCRLKWQGYGQTDRVRFNPVIEPLVSLFFSFGVVVSTENTCSDAIGIRHTLDLVPAATGAVYLNTFDILLFRESRNVGPVCTLHERRQAHSVHPNSAHEEDQV